MKLEEMSNNELLQLCVNSHLYNNWAAENGCLKYAQNMAAITLAARLSCLRSWKRN